jgi:metal-sulfur cluster biosynthetic enzyme
MTRPAITKHSTMGEVLEALRSAGSQTEAHGCGMGDVLKDDGRSRVQTIPGVSDVGVELVGDPPWDPSRMSDAARLELGTL